MPVTIRMGIFLGLLALTACEKKQDMQPKPADPTPHVTPAAAEKIKIKLLDAGAEPRQELRYKFEAGRKCSMMMEMNMDMELKLAGTPVPKVKMPPMRMGMEIDFKSVSPEGNLRYEFRLNAAEMVDTPGVDNLVASQLKTELAKIQGLSGRALTTSRGLTQDAEIKAPPGAGSQLQQILDSFRQQIRQMASPLPKEPVGIGASWEVHMPIDTLTFKFEQTAIFELLELSGNTAKIKVEIKQSAPKQQMKAPNLPPGASATLNSFASQGSGSTKIDLTNLVPESKMNMATNMASTIQAQGQTQNMQIAMKLDFKIWPK